MNAIMSITAVAGSFGPVNYVVLGAYLTVLVAINFYFAKRGKSTDDFLVTRPSWPCFHGLEARATANSLVGGWLVIAGIFAAAMSTLDSSMHSISTAVTTDFVRRFVPHLSESKYLLIARCLTIALGKSGTATAMLMASIEIWHLWDFFLGIMGLLGGTLAGLFLLGIFTQRVCAAQAWIGAIAGIGMLLYVKLATDLNSLSYGAIGVITCFSVACLSSTIIPTKVERLTGLNIYNVPQSK
jgi:Na+/proline symporter